MRGHGCTVVGSTVRHAVFNAVYTEISAALQSEAMRLGSGDLSYSRGGGGRRGLQRRADRSVLGVVENAGGAATADTH